MRRPLISIALLTPMLALSAGPVLAQVKPPPPPGTPTVKVAPGERYKAGSIRRMFLGGNYRQLWATPITVPVLDLGTFGGGLTPVKAEGGKQTRTLRLKAKSGTQYVFRCVDKDGLNLPDGYDHTIVESIARDQISALHPVGPAVSDVFLTRAGVLHPTPTLVVMPDDPLLGKFTKDFAGRLGFVEPYPTVPDSTTGFAGAIAIIDSDSLAVLLDANPRQRVDARAYLTARLVDIFVNDWDRHPGNWKWARMAPGEPWQPIARDRDRVLTTYEAIPRVLGEFMPQLISLKKTYPHMAGLTYNSIDLDRRLLSGLDAAAFNSVAVELKTRFTDAIIDSALAAMPAEYHASQTEMRANLRARREGLPAEAQHYFHVLSEVVDIHATDAADSAIVTLVDKDHVDVLIRSGGEEYFHRRFDPRDTRQIRVYLHGGDDHAVVSGDANPPFPIRIIGGNGNNQMVAASKPADKVRFYDEGKVTDVPYGDEPDFDRRPWVHEGLSRPLSPARDWGSGFSPAAKLESDGDDLGLVGALGITRKSYAFGTYPYSNRTQLVGEYSFGVHKFRVLGGFDKKWEGSPLHAMVKAHWSELEVINFFGFGNHNPATEAGPYYEVSQHQWMVYPSLAYALGPRSDTTVGVVFKQSSTDTTSGTFLGDTKPYGIGDFGQAGIRVGIYKDSRTRQRDAYRGVLFDLSATAYPKALDVTSQFEVYALNTAAYYTFPVIKRPFLSLKAGASKVHGVFPFHESAFIGGDPSERKLPHQRYAGDAAAYGSAELRIPLFGFAFILPIDIGAYVYGNAGRVYVDKESPDGWHTSRGAGVWIGILNPESGVSVDLGNYVGRNIVQAKIGFKF